MILQKENQKEIQKLFNSIEKNIDLLIEFYKDKTKNEFVFITKEKKYDLD